MYHCFGKTKVLQENISLIRIHVCASYRLWDIECGACLRVLEGHEELVRCIRFDSKRIVSGAYDGYHSHTRVYIETLTLW